MTKQLFLFGLLLGLQPMLLAQPGSTRSLLVGPTVGLNEVAYANTKDCAGCPAGSTPGGSLLGIQIAYRTNRLLISTKLLYQKRLYQVIPTYYGYESYTPTVALINTDLAVFTLPVSVGYQLLPKSRLHWYVGGNVVLEYLLAESTPAFFDRQGNRLAIPTPDPSGRPSVNAGIGLQSTFSYFITPGLGVQVEPAIRYYPRGFPTQTPRIFQFQGTASVLVNLGKG